MITDKLFIGNQWVASATPGSIPVVNATTEDIMASVPVGDAADVDRAVAAARAAFDTWSAMAPESRAALIGKVADGLEARADEIAQVITGETGMPIRLSSRIQVAAPIAAWRAYADMASRAPALERIGHSVVEYVPVGVIGCITPWNYPLHQVTGKVAAALAAGCTVVLKPSEIAPLSAHILTEVIAQSGLPAGVFNLVSGGGAVGAALVSHPDVDMISFTGSTATGRAIAACAAETVKRVALELGGKSAAIVLDDADLALAVKAAVGSCFLNSGQTCSAMTRLLVPRELLQEAVSLAVKATEGYRPGDPLDPTTRLGPLASAVQRDRVRGFIDAGIRDGAAVAAGGTATPMGLTKGFFVKPTILTGVDPRSTVAQEEIFGPVLCIIAYEGEDEAVSIANGVRYGLAAAVWAGSDERALRVARRLRAGQVDVNGAPFNLAAPFGGFGQSGIGRENGRFGLEAFLEIRSVQLPQRS